MLEEEDFLEESERRCSSLDMEEKKQGMWGSQRAKQRRAVLWAPAQHAEHTAALPAVEVRRAGGQHRQSRLATAADSHVQPCRCSGSAAARKPTAAAEAGARMAAAAAVRLPLPLHAVCLPRAARCALAAATILGRKHMQHARRARPRISPRHGSSPSAAGVPHCEL
jgi:hypothetical protein